MAGQKDFLDILRDIRGSAAPGQPLTDGIWYELTVADKNGNAGVYGDILAKYGVVTESAGTFDQAVAILENLNVEVTTLPAGSMATSALVNGVWQIGIPNGIDGVDGNDGSTPVVNMSYNSGNIKYTITVDGSVITDANIVNLDELVDSKVSTNVGVQETLEAKQEVIDAVEVVQGLVDSLDANVVAKKQEIATFTTTKIDEIENYSEAEKLEIGVYASDKVNEYNSNAFIKVSQYNANHIVKLSEYNINNALKLNQYNENHIDRLTDINAAYADRIVEMLKTRNFMGALDEYVAKTETHMITFLDTTSTNYIYYTNGTLLSENVDYTVYNNTTIELTSKVNPYDVIVQVNTQVFNDVLTSEGILFESIIGQPNGIAGLDSTGKVFTSQLPSYVDDVIEVATRVDLPAIGETSKIYIVVSDESSNGDTTSYRWTGSTYAVVSNTLNAADVKALYESNSNTNVYTNTEKTKLAGIEEGATADQTATEIEELYEGIADTNKYTDAEKSRVNINVPLQTTAQTLPEAINELDSRLDGIEDNTTLAEYGILDAYTKTQVQETLPAIGLDTTNTTPPTRVGQIKWNEDEGTVDLAVYGAVLQLGQEFVVKVRNTSGSIITNGTVVMATGSIGNSGRITVAPHDGTIVNATSILGVTTQDITKGSDGIVTILGKIRGINTTGSTVGETWIDGTKLYVKPNDGGRLTSVEPSDTETMMSVAYVVNAHTNGTLYVRVLGFDENHYKAWVQAKLDLKVDKVVGKQLSTEDYTTAEKDKLNSIAEGAEVNVKSDWNATTGDAEILNKPTTLAGYSIGNAYTKTEVNAALALKVDDAEIASVNLLRADKYLAAQNIANMVYTSGDLTKIQYKNATDVDYEVLNYNGGNLVSISHYTTGVLRGTTTLSYSSGNLVSAVFA